MVIRLINIILTIGLLTSCSQNTKNLSQGNGSTSIKSSNIKLNVKKYTLANGLRVLLIENHNLPIFSYYTFFDVGGRFEGKGTTGATHFLEHMMFKGAKKYGPGKFDTIIEGNGGKTNAYTNFDSTVYYQSMPSRMLDTILDLEADRMVDVLLEPKAFDSERQVIFNERKMRYENSPRGKLYYGMMQSMFVDTPYGGSVIGSVEDLTSLKRDEVKDFYHRFYTPDNAIIVVVGDIDTSSTIKIVKEKFGQLKASSSEIKAYKAKKDLDSLYTLRTKFETKHVKINGSSTTPLFSIAYKGERLGAKRGFTMDIISSIIGSGESSYFHQKYVKARKPLLTSVYAANYQLKKNGVFYVGGELMKGVNLNRFRSQFLRNASQICDKAITDRNVQKTKNQYLIDYYDELKTNAGVAHFVGNRENYFNDYGFYKKELEIYNDITTEEAMRVCKDIFASNKNIFISVWNKHPETKR
ncbi:MAG: insulinase family protein [Bacteriovoracaceae bacterium]|jgi:zinc protease|nr:insulinase family protein [Bacteriovoracaceae bacterium]